MTQSTNIRKSTVPSARLLMVAVVLLFAGFQLAFAQQLDVRGTVVSATDGLPVIGASVMEKGSSNGTVVAADGTYRIRVNRGAILVVSAIGFETQEVAAQAGTVDVILAEDNLWLNDAVVIGYGVQKKKLVTGSTVQVKGYKIDNWDEKGMVPYITKDGKMWAGYDNPKSISLKADNILKMGMKGLMYWDYDADDAAGTLRTAVWNAVMK